MSLALLALCAAPALAADEPPETPPPSVVVGVVGARGEHVLGPDARQRVTLGRLVARGALPVYGRHRLTAAGHVGGGEDVSVADGRTWAQAVEARGVVGYAQTSLAISGGLWVGHYNEKLVVQPALDLRIGPEHLFWLELHLNDDYLASRGYRYRFGFTSNLGNFHDSQFGAGVTPYGTYVQWSLRLPSGPGFETVLRIPIGRNESWFVTAGLTWRFGLPPLPFRWRWEDDDLPGLAPDEAQREM